MRNLYLLLVSMALSGCLADKPNVFNKTYETKSYSDVFYKAKMDTFQLGNIGTFKTAGGTPTQVSCSALKIIQNGVLNYGFIFDLYTNGAVEPMHVNFSDKVIFLINGEPLRVSIVDQPESGFYDRYSLSYGVGPIMVVMDAKKYKNLINQNKLYFKIEGFRDCLDACITFEELSKIKGFMASK